MSTTAAAPAYTKAGEKSGTGIWSWLTTVDHKRIGVLYLITSMVWFIIGGLEAVLIRAQLQQPNGQLLSAVPEARAPALDEGDPDRRRYLQLVRHALAAVLATLASADRLRLSLYYVEGSTLAEIGRALGEHESTASRHLNRCRRAIRRDTESWLHREGRLAAEEVRLALEYATEEWPYDLDLSDPARIPRSGVLI